jgi:class 3 adenylate cyclase/tetratricopeptide (TPR) repeat protein
MQACQVCWEANPLQARYCMSCGNTLRIATWSEEVRRVTVLFADLVGSTALIRRSDPEEARTLLDDVVRRLRAAVRHFGGSVSRVAGDGILALFGAPVVLEDHARRAALAALRMQEDMASDPLEGPNGERLMIRVGVNTGDVLLRSVASDLHVEYTAEGVTTHLAAKLQSAAEPGAVLVSGDVARLVEGFIELLPHAPLQIRGFGEPLAAFQLGRPTQTQSRFQVAVGRGLSPLVGRQQEFARLEQLATVAEGGHVRIAGVVGEPGVGKSRLLWEFGLRLLGRGWRVCSAPATLNGTALAFYPVLSLLGVLYRIDAEDSPAVLHSKLQAMAAGHGLDIAPLQVLFGLAAGDATWDMLDARERQERTQQALLAALIAASRQKPTVMSIEDLHEADAETLALIERLHRRHGEGRLLMLLEYRTGKEPGIERLPGFEAIAVEPLAEGDARTLFRQICGTDASFAALEGRLIERVAGNPFFIEEGLRMLGAAEAPGKRRSEMPIPGSVMDVIEARIAQLEPAEREVIKLASAVGKHAHLPILQGLCAGELQRLETSLGRLVEAGFLVEAGEAPPATLRFKHAVTQDVAYRMMTRPERRKIHSDIVGLLESQPLATFPERIALLGGHAMKAELWPQAVGYLERAAQLAVERASPREAVRLLDEALGVLPRLDESLRSVAREIDLRLGLRGPLLALGNLARIGDELRSLEQLAAACADAPRLGRVAVVIAGHCWLKGELRLAVEAGQRAIEIAARLGDFSLLVPARQYVGAALHELGEFAEASELLSANVEAVPEHAPGHAFGMAGLPAVFCRSTRSWLRAHLGAFAAARSDAEEALRIGRRQQRISAS